ncbi:MAG: sigma 54-interacting transcriptional regulator, partial [Vicinamibacterales bacterium]
DIAKRLATDPSSDLRCSIELVSASPLIDTGRVDKARSTAVWTFDVANSNQQLLPRARALGNMGLFTLYLGNAKQARNYLNEALPAADEMSFVRLGLADSLANVAMFEGNLKECSELLSEVDSIIQTHRVPARSWYDLAHQITRCLYLSHMRDWQGILDVVDRAHPELERRQLRVWHASLLSAKARALAHLGQHDEAENTLLVALKLCPRGAVDPLITVEAATGTCLTLRGDAERGARHFGRALRACQAISHRFHEWEVTKERESLKSHGALPQSERRTRNDTDDTNLILTDVSTLLSAGHSIDVMAHRLAAVVSTTPMHSRLDITNGAPASAPVSWDSGSDGTHRIILSDAERSLILTVRDVRLLEDVSLIRNLVEIAKTAVSQTGDRRQQDEDLLWPQVPLPSGGDAVFWSPRMQEVLRVALKLATSNLPVLITGETGTGKEVIARLIHANSKWARGPFVPYNASTVQKELVESQMFGHRRGAFTGALESSGGVIRAAENGTLFLDEIGDLDAAVQPKLLRFLESGEIHTLGDPRPTHIRVRVVAATNAQLETLVDQGRFRSDLFYRLRVATISMPPLRERKDEIPALAATFVRKACQEAGRQHLNTGADFVAALLLHEWPGNIRQLANEVRRAVALADDGGTLSAQDLSAEIAEGWVTRRPAQPETPTGPSVTVSLDQSLDRAVDDIERAFVERALLQTQGRVSDAARLLGISRKGLFLKRKKLGLN